MIVSGFHEAGVWERESSEEYEFNAEILFPDQDYIDVWMSEKRMNFAISFIKSMCL